MSCEFCRIEDNDLGVKVAEFDSIYVYLNDDQRFTGWTWIILEPHYDNLFDVPPALLADLCDATERVSTAIETALDPDRMNYGVLGNVIPHVHAHVIPRYEDDGNWGGPPWPHEERHFSEERMAELRDEIREALDIPGEDG